MLTAQNKGTNSARVNSTDFEKELQVNFPPTLFFFFFDGAKLKQFNTGIVSIRENLTTQDACRCGHDTLISFTKVGREGKSSIYHLQKMLCLNISCYLRH